MIEGYFWKWNVPPAITVLLLSTTLQENRLMKTTQLLRAAILGWCLTFASSAYAGYYTAKISNILFYDEGDLVYIYFVGGTQQRPPCADLSNGDYISFKMSRTRSKEYISGLLLAFSTGRTVTVATRGECIDQSNSDTLRYFTIN